MTRLLTLLIIGIFFMTASIQADTKDQNKMANNKYNAGIIAFNKGDFLIAYNYFTDAYILSQNSTTAYMIGVCCMKLDMPGIAMHYMRLALEGEPPLDESLRKDAENVLSWGRQQKIGPEFFKGHVAPK